MKAITIWQPHALMLAIGARIVETRSWPTNYRGKILIHAAKKLDEDRAYECSNAINLIRNSKFEPTPEAAHLTRVPFGKMFGVALAVATLRDCRPIPHPTGTEFDSVFGGFGEGRYGWFLDDLRPFRQPLPCKGFQGLWDVPADLEERVKLELTNAALLAALQGRTEVDRILNAPAEHPPVNH